MSKFKNGEWVRCIPKGKWGVITSGYRKGELYQVKDTYIDTDGERIHTVLDSNGSRTNGWNVIHFVSAYQLHFELEEGE